MQLKRLSLGMDISSSISQVGSSFSVVTARYFRGSLSTPPAEVGFFYAAHAGPSNGGSKIIAAEYSTGPGALNGSFYGFSANFTGLTKDMRYYVQAYMKSYVTDGIAMDYGNEFSFVAADFLTIGSLDVQQTDLSNQSDWLTANILCSESRVGGYSDWRLPTVGELGLIYANQANIGGLTGMYYWSSTQSDTERFYLMDFSEGSTTSSRQTASAFVTNSVPSFEYPFHVRAVRTH
jgi:hypothetical protein